MKPLIFALVILLSISCKNTHSNKQEKPGDRTKIKIAAYNFEYSRNATAFEIGEALKSFDFDVVCFSEAPGGDWTKNVGKTMGLQYVVVGKYSTAGHDDKYKTIASKTPLYEYDEVLMADTLHTATKAKTKINNAEISIYAVHFPFGWRDQAHINETTNKIVTFINHLKEYQKDEIAVVAGDFNFIPSTMEDKSQYYEMFVEAGLEVTWKELGFDWTKHNTHNAFIPEEEGNGHVIDHIIYNPEKMKVLDGQIIEMEKPLSDHKPVWALLQLTN